MRQQVLRSPKLQHAIVHMAGERPEGRNALTQRVLKMLREIQATPDTATIKGLEVLLDRVFHRIYAGIEVDMEGLDAAARRWQGGHARAPAEPQEPRRLPDAVATSSTSTTCRCR